MSTTINPPAPSALGFTEIPYNWKVPGDYMEVKAAVNLNAVMAYPARGNIAGQMYAAGIATPGKPYQLLSADQANTLFGAGSQAAMMAAWWLQNNPYTSVDIIGISDAAESTKAVYTVTLGGTATGPGTLALYFGGIRVATGVNIGDTAADVAANLFAQLQLQGQSGYPYLPSLVPTYTAAGVLVTLTCGHGGTLGNEIDIRVNYQTGDVTPAGLTVAIAQTVQGAIDPSNTIEAAFDALTSTWYTDTAFAWTDETNITMIADWAAARYGAMVKLDVQVYVGLDDSYGTALTFAPNSQFITPLPMQNSLTPPWLLAAAMAAQCCYWSAQAPSLQMATVPLVGVVAPAQADVFSQDEQQQLLLAGLSTYVVDSVGNVYLQRVTTSYRSDPSGVLNNAYFDLQSTKVPSRVRYDWNAYCSEVYPRNQLCKDGSLAAQYNPWAVTPGDLEASWTARSAIYEQNGWIQNSVQTAKASSFAIDANDGNRVNARQQIQIMGNLIVLAGSLEFISNN